MYAISVAAPEWNELFTFIHSVSSLHMSLSLEGARLINQQEQRMISVDALSRPNVPYLCQTAYLFSVARRVYIGWKQILTAINRKSNTSEWE